MDHVIRTDGEYPPQRLHSPQGGMVCSPADKGIQQPMPQHGSNTLRPQGTADAMVSHDVT